MSSNSPAAETIVPELLTTKEAARLCGMGERTFWRHSRSGAAPAPLKIGGAVRYRRAELLEWIAGGCLPIDGSAPR
jgi:predicted DNA-binding transcriptional regulator AlpA